MEMLEEPQKETDAVPVDLREQGRVTLQQFLPPELAKHDLELYNETSPQQAAGVNAPTQIVWGREDHLMPLECGDLYQQAIPGSEWVVLDRCGHAPHLEKPDEFVAIAMQFLP